MIFDSEEQKQRVIDLVGEVPVNTTIGGLASGVSPDLAALLDALQRAHVMSPEEQQKVLPIIGKRE